jgi:serine/threonine-protein kinase
MVSEHGGVKIMDFGIARVVGAEHLTNDGHMMGTPAYMAPEQVIAKDVDGRADLYSAGVVFYRLLSGNLPFQADTAIGMVQKQLSDAPTPVHVHRAGLPDWCDAILRRALAKSPADRFQTAEDFRTTLLSSIGASGTEHTGAFAAAQLGTTPSPLATPGTPGMMSGAPLPTPAAQPAPAGTSGASKTVPVGRPPTAQKSAAPMDGATIVLQKNHFAMAGGLLAVVAIGVAVLAFVALRRPATVAAPAPTQAAVTAPVSSQAPAPATVQDPAPAQANAPAASPASGSTGAVRPATPPLATPTTAPDPPAPTGSAGATTTAGTGPTGTTVAARRAAPAAIAANPAKPAAAEPVHGRKEMAPFVFDAKAVVSENGKNREHDTRVVLADGTLTVSEKNNKVVAAVPFAAVLGLTSSNSKQPMWNTPQGPAEMVHVDGGAFGFLKGGRNWVGVRTKDMSLVLRVDDDDVGRVLAAIEERTGHKAERVLDRKDK